MKGAWVLLAAAAAMSCVGPEPGPDGAETLQVLWDGCDDLGDRCVGAGPERPLRVWVAGEEALAIRVDGRPIEVEPVLIDGGQRVIVELPESARELQVSAQMTGSQWSLKLGDQPERPSVDTVDCAALPTSPVARAMARVHCARTRLSEAPDDAPRVEASRDYPRELARAARTLRAEGWTTEATRLLSTAVYMAGRSGQGALAHELVAEMEEVGCVERRWTTAFTQASLALEEQDYRSADAHLARVERLTLRLGLEDRRLQFQRSVRGDIASKLGDLDGALETFLAAADAHPSTGACDPSRMRAAADTNVAWIEMLRRRAGLEAHPDVDPRQRLLAALSEHALCGASSRTGAVRANLAFEAWMRADWAEVRAQAEALPADARALDRTWVDAALAEALLAEGDPSRAERRAVEAGRRAAASGQYSVVPLLAVIAAEAALADGRRDAAREHLVRGQRAVLQGLPGLPSYTEPSAFFGMNLRVAPRLVALQVELALADEDPAQAFALLRRLRAGSTWHARRLDQISKLSDADRAAFEAARERHEGLVAELADEVSANWSLSGEALVRAEAEQQRVRERLDRALSDALALLPEPDLDDGLRAPARGELLVAFVPVDGRWVAFLADADRVRVLDGPADTPEAEALTEGLVALLLPHLDGVEQLTILPWGPVHDLDLHTRPHEGVRLIDRVDVAWSMDLPPAPAVARSQGLVVVGDPDGTLPAARAEASAVAAPVQATLLLGAQATRESTLSALEGASAWHFAGHGRLAAERSWRSGLQLSDGRLDVSDLLSLRAAPRLTVLSGCETGRAPRRHGVATLGMAQALLVSGGEAVVASSRPVVDADAATRVSGLLLGDPTAEELVSRLNASQRDASPTTDSGAWRVWIR